MGRPRLTWTDAQVRALLTMLPAFDRDFPQDNAAFLDALIAELRLMTGRIFGATAYDNILRNIAPQAGVMRRPSSATIQQAVARAHALTPEVCGHADGHATAPGGGSGGLDVETVRQTLAPVVRAALAPLHAMLAEGAGTAARDVRSGETEGRGSETELLLTRAALDDAHARIRRLEAERAELQRELGAAQSARDLAGQHVQAMMGGLLDAIGAAGVGAKDLADTARRLAGTEQFLKLQNDAVRQQATAVTDALRAQNASLRERVDHLLIENDQYRRTLGRQRAGASGTP
ncbi:conserved hypothetical protein [Paraburkholderia tropica]|nr:conserved hypothetical protein [Paraburkholderia tropica]